MFTLNPLSSDWLAGQIDASRFFKIAISKSCCPVCWDIVTIFNNLPNSESGNTPPIRFHARRRHPNLYAVDIPDILDEGVKDELLRKFSIILLKDLVSLLNEEAARTSNAKHAPRHSSVSQPESLTFSTDSTLGGSVDINTASADQQASDDHMKSLKRERVELWNRLNLDSVCNTEHLELWKWKLPCFAQLESSWRSNGE